MFRRTVTSRNEGVLFKPLRQLTLWISIASVSLLRARTRRIRMKLVLKGGSRGRATHLLPMRGSP
jgi:hypothetical protein